MQQKPLEGRIIRTILCWK